MTNHSHVCLQAEVRARRRLHAAGLGRPHLPVLTPHSSALFSSPQNISAAPQLLSLTLALQLKKQ